MPSGGYKPKSPAGRLALTIFVVGCVLTVLVLLVVNG
jgi:hypothetical protein